MNKKRVFILGSLVCLIILAIIYLGVTVFYQYHFLPGTIINGKDYSNMTTKAVTTAIQDDIRLYYLKIIERNNGVEHIAAADIDLNVSIDGDLSSIKEAQNSYLWFVKPENEAKLAITTTYNETQLEYIVNGLKCLNDNYINEGTPPELTYDGTVFTLTEGTIGNQIDKEKTKNSILNSIKSMDSVLNLETAGCYLDTMEDGLNEKLNNLLVTLNSYLDVVITIEFGEEKEIIDRAQIHKWLSVDVNNNIVFDKEAIVNYVDSFASKYETMGQSRPFKTSKGNEIKVSGGDYGWWINRNAEADAIIENIENLNSCTREANYLQVAGSHGEVDFGDTYIEINLYDQHLYAYKDGVQIVDANIISGDSTIGKSTPTGVFNMRFMFRNYNYVRGAFTKTLKYWMVFYGNSVETNIGIASCNWLSSFGGTIYKGAGSVGSIYLNESDAATLYMQLPGSDFPVIIYNSNN